MIDTHSTCHWRVKWQKVLPRWIIIFQEVVSQPIFLPPAGLIACVKVADFIQKNLNGQKAHMFTLQLFVGAELLDSGALSRGKIQGMLQEYTYTSEILSILDQGSSMPTV